MGWLDPEAYEGSDGYEAKAVDGDPGWVRMSISIGRRIPYFVAVSSPFRSLKLLLVDAMSTSVDEDLQDAARTLQYQIYYNGEALERMLECMRSYKDQSFGYVCAVSF